MKINDAADEGEVLSLPADTEGKNVYSVDCQWRPVNIYSSIVLVDIYRSIALSGIFPPKNQRHLWSTLYIPNIIGLVYNQELGSHFLGQKINIWERLLLKQEF